MSRKYNGIVVNGKAVHSWTDTDSKGNSVTVVHGDFSSQCDKMIEKNHSSETGLYSENLGVHYAITGLVIVGGLLMAIGFIALVLFFITRFW